MIRLKDLGLLQFEMNPSIDTVTMNNFGSLLIDGTMKFSFNCLYVLRQSKLNPKKLQRVVGLCHHILLHTSKVAIKKRRMQIAIFGHPFRSIATRYMDLITVV
jgi:hypothetical protein